MNVKLTALDGTQATAGFDFGFRLALIAFGYAIKLEGDVE